jgi:hypothetical protein
LLSCPALVLSDDEVVGREMCEGNWKSAVAD